jgi:hypothetical protein
LQPTSENVRRALEGNAANPGLIPGLVNSTPSTEADDQAAMARARAGSGGGGSTSALPTPPVPPQQTAQQTTLPPLDTGDGNDVAMQILRGLGLGAGGSALAGAALGAGRRMMGNRSAGAPGEPNVNIAAPPGEPPLSLAGPETRLALPAPEMPGGPATRLGITAPPEVPALPAPPLRIAGPAPPTPPLPINDPRPIAVPEEPIILPASPASPAIDKAVGGEGDVAAPKRARAPRARTPKVRVPG